jgi:hypothetical protein
MKWLLTAGGCLIEVATQAGLTVPVIFGQYTTADNEGPIMLYIISNTKKAMEPDQLVHCQTKRMGQCADTAENPTIID